MTSRPADAALRRCALAASLLYDVDAEPGAAGVTLPGVPAVVVSWAELRRALAGEDPDSTAARDRVAYWLLGRRWLADRPYPELLERVRPLGLPADHVLHPGLDWVETRVLGDALDVGVAFVGLDPDEPDATHAFPRELLTAAGLDPDEMWTRAGGYLHAMAELAVERFHRSPQPVLRPMGDCDVVTLLADPQFRTALAAAGGGMRAVAVPMRTRGWLDLSRIDPAFVIAAAGATDAPQRGFSRPLLVTAEEVVLAAAGGEPARLALADPAAPEPVFRDVLYR